MFKNHSVKELQIVLDSINDPIMVINRDFRVLLMNSAAEKSACAIDDKTDSPCCYQISHNRTKPCDSLEEPCPVEIVFKTGKPTTVFHRHTDKGNNKEIYEISASPMFDESHEVMGVVETSRNITDKEVAKALLKEHQDLKRLFNLVEIAKNEWEKTMDCVGDMVVLTDKNGKIKRCNKSLKEFTGKQYNDLIGKDLKETLTEHGIENSASYGRDTELCHRPTNRWFVINAYPVKGILGDDIFGTVITLHDTTELKRVTSALEQTNRKLDENRKGLQSALDEISSLIQRVTKEKTFDIRFSNPNLKKCYEAKNCKKSDCPCFGAGIVRCWQIAGTNCGGKVQGYFAQKYENCLECPVFKEATVNPIYQIGEHFNNMMHILELKNRELEQAYEELKNTQAKILQQEKMASIGQLAAGVAHEINNPMGFIASNLGTMYKYAARFAEYIDALSDAIKTCATAETTQRLDEMRKTLKLDFILEDTRKLIAESLDGADRVKVIVQNLKNFSRVDQAEAKPANINECIETTLNIVWNELKYKTTVKKEYGELPFTKCYPQQLNQVFMNLLVNATHAIEKRGEITIRTWSADGSLFASVSDTGCGIPKENLNRIFEPFFTTKEVGKGTGLGLSIAYDIVKKHEGDIFVESEVGKGTTFTVRIPVKEGQ